MLNNFNFIEFIQAKMYSSLRVFFSHKSKIYYSIPDKLMTVILIYNRSKLMSKVL